MWNINAPQGRIPCAIFRKFAEFVLRFKMRYLSKFRCVCSRGYGDGGSKLTGSGYPQIFSVPSGETICIRHPNVLEVQERARGPLSPCQVWWGSDFTRRRAAKNVEFFISLFVRLSVCPSRI